MLRLAFDFIITWRETRTRPNAYDKKRFGLFSAHTRHIHVKSYKYIAHYPYFIRISIYMYFFLFTCR